MPTHSTQRRVPKAPDSIKWYHKLSAFPLQTMANLNLGPLGGENSISAVIEAVLAMNRGEDPGFELSKTDKFFVKQLTGKKLPDEMIEYRQLNHEAQLKTLEFNQNNGKLSVAWLGAGVFVEDHPLLKSSQHKISHLWTDASRKIASRSRPLLDILDAKGRIKFLSYSVILPKDIVHLNAGIKAISPTKQGLIINGYGVTYALTVAENQQWLSQLELPDDIDVYFIFNSPGKTIPFLPGVMAAFHNQRMVCYDRGTVAALFESAIPGTKIVWEKSRKETQIGYWATWVLVSTAESRRAKQN